MQTDFDFFETEVERFQEQLNEGSLMNKRIEQEQVKKDPLDELGEVYIEVQIIEQDFQKALEMC